MFSKSILINIYQNIQKYTQESNFGLEPRKTFSLSLPYVDLAGNHYLIKIDMIIGRNSVEIARTVIVYGTNVERKEWTID